VCVCVRARARARVFFRNFSKRKCLSFLPMVGSPSLLFSRTTEQKRPEGAERRGRLDGCIASFGEKRADRGDGCLKRKAARQTDTSRDGPME